jgi:hypothetical protein
MGSGGLKHYESPRERERVAVPPKRDIHADAGGPSFVAC